MITVSKLGPVKEATRFTLAGMTTLRPAKSTRVRVSAALMGAPASGLPCTYAAKPPGAASSIAASAAPHKNILNRFVLIPITNILPTRIHFKLHLNPAFRTTIFRPHTPCAPGGRHRPGAGWCGTATSAPPPRSPTPPGPMLCGRPPPSGPRSRSAGWRDPACGWS